MRGTARLRTAYHNIMEPFVWMLLFTMLEKDGSAGSALRKFLAVYRENRELFAMLAGNAQAPDNANKCAAARSHDGKTCGTEACGRGADTANEGKRPTDEGGAQCKSRPREEVGSVDILKAYLAQMARQA